MNRKKCPYCRSFSVVRKGFQQGHQRWKCKECHKKFQANRKALPAKEELFCLYTFNKQTLAELAEEYHIETNKVQELMDEVVIPPKVHKPRPIALVVDTTFVGDLAVIVFRDQKKRENLWWIFAEDEKLVYYQLGKVTLEKLGYTIISVTADGLPGLPNVFNEIPFQFCHFHAQKNITKYLTKRPKLLESVELKHIMSRIMEYNHDSFVLALYSWRDRHYDFLQERTVHPDGNWSYTHRRLRSAIRSMLKMSSYLFTYQSRTDIRIPTTSNTLEGHFSHLKVRLKVHRGLSLNRKKKVIQIILLNSSVTYKKNIHEKLF